MTSKRNFLWHLLRNLALLLLFSTSVNLAFAQESAEARFVHVIPNVAPIDVYINGTLAVTNLEFGAATTYLEVPAGDHILTITPTGISAPIWEQTITAEADTAATYIASSAENARFDRFEDNLAATTLGNTRLLLVHALAGGPALDVQLAEAIELNGVIQDPGTSIATGMAYTTTFGSFDLPAQTYVFNIVPNEGSGFDVLISSAAMPLSSSTSYMAVVYGTQDNPQTLLLSRAIATSTDSGFVRFVHGAVGTPDVDVYVNDILVVPSLNPQNPTEHLALPVGEHNLVLREAGTEDEILSGTLTIAANSAQTVVAFQDADGILVNAFEDNISDMRPDGARVSVINAVPDTTTTVTLSDGTPVGEDVAFGEAAEAVALAPVATNIDFALTLGDTLGNLNGPVTTFYGGVYYNVVIVPGDAFSSPSIIVAPTSLAQTVASAPGAGDTTIASNTSSSIATDPSTTDSTDSSEVVESAPQPAAPAQVTTPVPSAASEDAVTGRILLDPSANLQLRQFPSVDALSLGLAPSGTVLEVNGREGQPEALVEGQDPPPEAENFVDPATLLADENSDLDPAQTWLNVTYSTPDGGEIDAWVLAQFLEVRDEDGDLQRLAELPTVPGNLPGEAVATELTPPPIPEDRVVAEVFNLNPGVGLNVRRRPSTDAEVLTRLTNDTLAELLGFLGPVAPEDTVEVTPVFDPENTDWVFISYQPPEGGTITGWISTIYVRYLFNGQRISPTELEERDLLEVVEADQTGEIAGGAQQVALPTVDPLRDAFVAEVELDPSANLQFRRSPDATAESLNLIPSGTRVIIESRNAEGDWLKATFEGEEGWISANFVSLTFNGNAVDVLDIPIETDITANGEPTPEGSG